jgi:hypothetical protein
MRSKKKQKHERAIEEEGSILKELQKNIPGVKSDDEDEDEDDEFEGTEDSTPIVGSN